ncbi:MAG: RNA repair transcriptional activator RtcR [Bdellovibrionota bacterium]
MKRKKVIIGLLGTTLDSGPRGPKRWELWRPSVQLFQHEELLIDRFELLSSPSYTALCEQVVKDINTVSPETTVRCHTVKFDDPWDFEEVYGKLYDFARGYPFKTDKEEYYVHISTGTHVAQICLFLLTESRHLPAQLIQTSPPPKSDKTLPGEYRVIDLDLSRYDTIAERFSQEQREDISLLKSGIETRNRAFNELITEIEFVAAHSKEPMLLIGPTGVGKSQLAKRIYELKRQNHKLAGAFVEMNCSTLRGETSISTLFGHTKGAFTGADRPRDGLLLSANRGILFLDEIAELGLDEQAMLLRAVEEKRFFPVGADREVSADFQLIAGTNTDLLDAVKRGAFRADLLARINLWTFHLPALRERMEDIAPNIEYELAKCSTRLGRQISINREARERYLRFAQSAEAAWSGNFRDLNASVLRMATLATAGRITEALVDQEIHRLRLLWSADTRDEESIVARLIGGERASELDLFDRLQLEAVLEICAGSRSLSDAGRRLFAASRDQKASQNDADRLRKYLRRFDISWADVTALDRAV